MTGPARPFADRWRQLLLLCIPIAMVAAPARAESGAAGASAPGTRVWVGAHRLHLYCQGSGSPTVVFDSGLGGSSLDWALVQPEVASFTRACAYDRAGYAWSDPGPQPRDAGNILRDLEQLLGNGSVAAPYVFVGHSLGGLIAQQFARRNPQRMAGLVLVDATHEDQFRRLEELIMPRGKARRSTLLTLEGSGGVPEGLPDDVKRMAGAFESRAQSIVATRSELSWLRAMARRAPAAGMSLPDVPLVVISHREDHPDPATREGRFAQIWMDMQLELAQLARRSRHVVASTDDHYVHVREPEIVIDAVRSVVMQHRDEAGEANRR